MLRQSTDANILQFIKVFILLFFFILTHIKVNKEHVYFDATTQSLCYVLLKKSYMVVLSRRQWGQSFKHTSVTFKLNRHTIILYIDRKLPAK